MNNAYGWYGGERVDGGTRDQRPAKSRPSQRRRLAVDRKSFGFYHNLMGFPKVTVGEISGFALGGGLRDGAHDGHLRHRAGYPHRHAGHPVPRSALGSLHMFFHRLGPVLAWRRMLLTGDIVEAAAVENLGVFTETRCLRRFRPGRGTGR